MSQQYPANPNPQQPFPQAGQAQDPYAQQQGSAAEYNPGAAPASVGSWDQTAAYTQQQPYQGAPAFSQEQTSKSGGNPGFFKALFDLSFSHFVTIRFAGIFYVLALVVAALWYVGGIIMSIFFGAAVGAISDSSSYSSYGSGSDSGSSFTPGPLLVAIFLGWIPCALFVLFVRVGLEFVVSSVRTAQNTTHIVENTNR